MGILTMIIVGFIVGLLARALKPGNDRMGLIMTTLVGIVIPTWANATRHDPAPTPYTTMTLDLPQLPPGSEADPTIAVQRRPAGDDGVEAHPDLRSRANREVPAGENRRSEAVVLPRR